MGWREVVIAAFDYISGIWIYFVNLPGLSLLFSVLDELVLYAPWLPPSTNQEHKDTIRQLTKDTHFSRRQLVFLYRRFKKLDSDNTDSVSTENIMSDIIGLGEHPLLLRIVTLMDVKENDTVTFTDFVRTLSCFHRQAPVDEKIRFAFEVFNISSNDDFLSRHDLFVTLKTMLGTEGVLVEDVENIVHLILSEGDPGALESDRLTYDEFYDVMIQTDIASDMSLRF